MNHDTAARDAYNDAELIAIEVVRATCQEAEAHELMALVNRMSAKHGPMGNFALVAALARHAAIHVDLSADRAGITSDAWLDDWALHKLQQHQVELDEGDD